MPVRHLTHESWSNSVEGGIMGDSGAIGNRVFIGTSGLGLVGGNTRVFIGTVVIVVWGALISNTV